RPEAAYSAGPFQLQEAQKQASARGPQETRGKRSLEQYQPTGECLPSSSGSTKSHKYSHPVVPRHFPHLQGRRCRRRPRLVPLLAPAWHARYVALSGKRPRAHDHGLVALAWDLERLAYYHPLCALLVSESACTSCCWLLASFPLLFAPDAVPKAGVFCCSETY